METVHRERRGESECFAAGILVGLAELISAIDFHDENVLPTSNGWAIVDAETILTRTTRRRVVTLNGHRVDIMDTPLCSSLLPLWIREIPSGVGFRSGLLGQRVLDSLDDKFAGGTPEGGAVSIIDSSALIDGYLSLLGSTRVLPIVMELASQMLGTHVRVALRATAEYGLYRSWYVHDCVMGEEADIRLEARLRPRAEGELQWRKEMNEIRSVCIPKFEREVDRNDLNNIKERWCRMRGRSAHAINLIRASLQSASLVDARGISAACDGDFDHALRFIQNA